MWHSTSPANTGRPESKVPHCLVRLGTKGYLLERLQKFGSFSCLLNYYYLKVFDCLPKTILLYFRLECSTTQGTQSNLEDMYDALPEEYLLRKSDKSMDSLSSSTGSLNSNNRLGFIVLFTIFEPQKY